MRISIFIFLLLLSSCATNFNLDEHCSPKALEYLAKDRKTGASKKSEAEVNKQKEKLLKTIMSFKDNFHKCYQEKLLDKKIIESYQVCVVVGVDEKGLLEFLDVDDHKSNLNSDLKSCVVEKFKSLDYRGIGQFNMTSPLNFYPVRN